MLESIILQSQANGVTLRFKQGTKEPELFEALVEHLEEFYASQFFDKVKDPNNFIGAEDDFIGYALEPVTIEELKSPRGAPRWAHSVYGIMARPGMTRHTGTVEVFPIEEYTCFVRFSYYTKPALFRKMELDAEASNEHARRFYEYTQRALNPELAPRRLYLVKFLTDSPELFEYSGSIIDKSKALVSHLQRTIAKEIEFPIIFMGDAIIENLECSSSSTGGHLLMPDQKIIEILYDFVENIHPDWITNKLTGKQDNRTRTIVYTPPNFKTVEKALPVFSDREIIRKATYLQVQ